MKDKLKALIDERNSIWSKMQELAERGFESAEVREQYEQMETDLDDRVEVEITALERHLARDASIAAAGVPVETPETPEEDEGRNYEDTFDRWMRFGYTDLGSEERATMQDSFTSHDGQQFSIRDALSSGEKRALGSVSGAAGGFTVPEGFWNQIVDARTAFGGLRNAPVFILTTGEGNDIPIPTGDDDSGNRGVYVGENTQITEQDISFDQKVLKAFTITSRIVRVPLQLLQDGAFDVAAYLAGKLGERIGRGEADAFVNGNGLQGPEGLVTAAPVGFTVSGTDSFVYADFVEFVHSVDPVYRADPSAGFVFSDSVLRGARLITISSTDSRPLWQPGLTQGEPNTILGFSYTIDQEFPALATTSNVAAFGALRNYWIRDVKGIQMLRLEERYAEFLQVGFLAFARNDGRLIDAGTNPIKLLRTS